MKKQINEQQLRALTARLNERTSNVDEGVWDDMKAGYKKYAPAFLGGTPAAPAGAQATKPPAKPAAPAGAPKVAYDKTMPAATVQELQTKLNAKDPTLKLTVDGKLGPATKAAMAKYPDVTTDPNAPQNQAPAAVDTAPVPASANASSSYTGAPAAPAAAPEAPAAAPAPEAPAAAPAPGMTAQGDDEGNTTITRPDGSTMVVGADGKQIMPGSNPNLPQNKGVVNTVKNAVAGTGDFQKPTGFIPPAAAPAAAPAPAAQSPYALTAKTGAPGLKAESIGFQNDELSRIVSLVHHR